MDHFPVVGQELCELYCRVGDIPAGVERGHIETTYYLRTTQGVILQMDESGKRWHRANSLDGELERTYNPPFRVREHLVGRDSLDMILVAEDGQALRFHYDMVAYEPPAFATTWEGYTPEEYREEREWLQSEAPDHFLKLAG